MLRILYPLLVLAGCVSPLASDDAPIGRLLEDCEVPGLADAPVSLEYSDGSLWLWPSGSAFVSDRREACGGGVELGPPVLELTEQERAASVVLEPLGGFVDGELGYLFYALFSPTEVLG